MSDAVFANLPRFDANAGRTRAPGSWLKELDGHAPPDLVEKPAPRLPEPAVKADAPVVEASPQPLDLKKIEASLITLNSRLDKIEREAHAQTLQTIQSVAAKLFPELSREFLAEEIGRHLAALVPASAAVVEIRAEASLADKLRVLVERTPSLAHRCTVTSVAAEGQGNVEVSWQAGGLSFDFDGLLQACLSHLTSIHTATKE
jgi:hypothetical protein